MEEPRCAIDALAINRFRVVACDRRVHGIRPGDPVVLLPVEAVLADAQLLALPTVRRVAREGLRGVVLVPLAEWRERLKRPHFCLTSSGRARV